MGLTVLVVNKNRYLINDEVRISDKICKDIIDEYPDDCIIEFDDVRMEDLNRKRYT